MKDPHAHYKLDEHRYYLQGRAIFNVKREAIGFGETLVLTPLFRELKLKNPLLYTILTTNSERVRDIQTLMKGQPFPDKICAFSDEYRKYARETHNIGYYEIDFTDVNYSYEQKVKPNVLKSRSKVCMDYIGLTGSSKPFYKILEEDLLWFDKQKLPNYYILVQLKGAELYKYCNKEMLRHYCNAIRKLFPVIVVDDKEIVNWEGIISIVPPDIRKAITLSVKSLVTIGFDSLFQQVTAALDVPYIGFLGPTSCPGRQSDHKYATYLRSNKECEPCLRESLSTCRITGEKDISACLYYISLDEITRSIIQLINQREAVLGSSRSYFPGSYYKDFDPSSEYFKEDTSDMTKIHQPVHDDGSYLAKSQEERVNWLVKNAIPNEGILDIGCANGYIIDAMQPPNTGFRHCGIDIDSDRIRMAKKTKKKDIDFYQINAILGLPFKDNSFSTVILAEVLEHMDFEEAKEVLKEAYRIAKQKVLITMPFYDESYIEDKERIGMVEDKDHKWLVSRQKVETLLENYKHSVEFTKFALIQVIK